MIFFIGKICDIFRHHCLDVFKFAVICKTSRIMFYELTVTIILDMPYLYECSFLGKTCDIFYQ